MSPCGTWNANTKGGVEKRGNCLWLIGRTHQTSNKSFCPCLNEIAAFKV
jgi:hypothetical protein